MGLMGRYEGWNSGKAPLQPGARALLALWESADSETLQECLLVRAEANPWGEIAGWTCWTQWIHGAIHGVVWVAGDSRDMTWPSSAGGSKVGFPAHSTPNWTSVPCHQAGNWSSKHVAGSMGIYGWVSRNIEVPNGEGIDSCCSLIIDLLDASGTVLLSYLFGCQPVLRCTRDVPNNFELPSRNWVDTHVTCPFWWC